jgi:hypothetical protein
VKIITSKDRIASAQKKRAEAIRSDWPKGSEGEWANRGAHYKGTKAERILDSLLSPYIHLECGHLTTIEDDERYRLWRPEKYKHYCDICDKWIKRMKPPKPKPLPEEPMF